MSAVAKEVTWAFLRGGGSIWHFLANKWHVLVWSLFGIRGFQSLTLWPTFKSMQNKPPTVPVCNVPMDAQTAITGLLWFGSKLEKRDESDHVMKFWRYKEHLFPLISKQIYEHLLSVVTIRGAKGFEVPWFAVFKTPTGTCPCFTSLPLHPHPNRNSPMQPCWCIPWQFENPWFILKDSQ